MKAVFGLLVLGVMVGCESTVARSELVGQWGMEAVPVRGESPVSRNVRGLVSSTLSIDLAEDGTFRMAVVLVPVEGTWRQEGSTVVLETKEVLGFRPTDAGEKGPVFKDGVARLRFDPAAKTLVPTDQPQEGWVLRRVMPK